MKASDLPFGVKQKMLDQVRRQMGETSYNYIVSERGEDGLLDLLLKKSGASREGGCLSLFWGYVVATPAVWIPALACWLFGEEGAGYWFGAWLLVGCILTLWQVARNAISIFR